MIEEVRAMSDEQVRELREEQRRENAENAERRRARRESTGLQPCVNCGTLSRNRWCSTSCMAAEDGVPYDDVDVDEADDDE